MPFMSSFCLFGRRKNKVNPKDIESQATNGGHSIPIKSSIEDDEDPTSFISSEDIKAFDPTFMAEAAADIDEGVYSYLRPLHDRQGNVFDYEWGNADQRSLEKSTSKDTEEVSFLDSELSVTEDLAAADTDIKTLLDVIHAGHKRSPNGPCVGERDPIRNYSTYKWMTYDQVIRQVNCFAAGLLSKGLRMGQETRVALYSANSIQWVIAQFAIWSNSMVVVPVYDRINLRDYQMIVNQTQTECVIVDSLSRTQDVISQLAHTPNVRIIITGESDITDRMVGELEDNFTNLYTFEEVVKEGKDRMAEVSPFLQPSPQDLAQVCFTSGTTGQPKGVLQTHNNLVSAMKAVHETLAGFIDLADECLLSFIPLSQSMSLVVEMMMYSQGGRVAIYSGDIQNLIDDLKVSKPTIIVTIPRFLDNIYNRIIYSVKGSGLKTKLMAKAFKMKEKEISDRTFMGNKGLLQKVVFKKSRNVILGGQVKVIINGGGPLSFNVLHFLRVALGCTILDSYGLIECSGFATITAFKNYQSYHSGGAIACCEVKLIDLPEFGHVVSQTGIGEICIKGSNVSPGYFDCSIPSGRGNFLDGWLRTGDIGSWTADHKLKVIERKENIIRLNSGIYVAPERIQSIYNQSAFVSESFVDSVDDNFLVAIVVPEIDYLNRWCVQNRVVLNTDQACKDYLFKHHVLSDMLSTGEREGLKPFEQVRNIYLHPKAFSVENNLLTPIFETRRTYCKQYFKTIIQDLARAIVDPMATCDPSRRMSIISIA